MLCQHVGRLQEIGHYVMLLRLLRFQRFRLSQYIQLNGILHIQRVRRNQRIILAGPSIDLVFFRYRTSTKIQTEDPRERIQERTQLKAVRQEDSASLELINIQRFMLTRAEL